MHKIQTKGIKKNTHTPIASILVSVFPNFFMYTHTHLPAVLKWDPIIHEIL